jgi:hypothetical protein
MLLEGLSDLVEDAERYLDQINMLAFLSSNHVVGLESPTIKNIQLDE